MSPARWSPRALKDAIPIAQMRGLIQLAGKGPERLFDINIVSKIPIAFIRVKFAPEILASLTEISADFREEIRRLRLIARDAAITAELWLRSKHGTWRFFLVTEKDLIELDSHGWPLRTGATPG
jgi:hypothetical protein